MNIHLVQRIQKPSEYLPNNIPPLIEYYSEPSTQETRQLFKESRNGLNKLIPLDYMGSAEFEFGEVPKCLRRISNNRKEYISFEFEISGSPKIYGVGKIPDVTSKKVKLYVRCLPGQEKTIVSFFENETDASSSPKFGRLKESTYVQNACFGEISPTFKKSKPIERNVSAWLDITNDWFVGKDPQQIKELSYLLGIE